MKRLYPFNVWFNALTDPDGRARFELRRGEHYDCSQSSFAQQLRQEASRRGVRVSLTDLEDRFVVVLVHDAQERLDRVEAERETFGDPDELLASRERNA